MCLCVLDLKLGGNDLTKGRPCVFPFFLSFSLSLIWMFFLLEQSLLSLCPCRSLSLSVSLCLTVSHPFLITPFGPPTAAAGKVLYSFFLLIFCLCTLSARSSWSLVCFPCCPSSPITVDFLYSSAPHPLFCHCSPWNSSVSDTTN